MHEVKEVWEGLPEDTLSRIARWCHRVVNDGAVNLSSPGRVLGDSCMRLSGDEMPWM